MKFTTFGAPSPRNVTLRKHTVHGGLQMTNGTLTLIGALFQEAYTCAAVGCTSHFNAELIPVHSPLLRESCLVSYPPLTYMLKFSGFADLTSCQGIGEAVLRSPEAIADRRRRDNRETTARRSVSCSPMAAECAECIKGRDTLVHRHEPLAHGLLTRKLKRPPEA